MKILSITTADYSSHLSHVLSKFLESCCKHGVDVVLLLRDFPKATDFNPGEYPCIKTIQYIPQCGLSIARNIGIDIALGGQFNIENYQFVTFLDDDCQVTDFLKPSLSSHHESDIVVGSYGPSFNLLSNRFFPLVTNLESLNATLNRVASCTLYFHPSVIKRLGHFYPNLGVPNVKYTVGEDTEYFLRAIRHGFKFEIDAQVFVVHPYKDKFRSDTLLTDILLSMAYFNLNWGFRLRFLRQSGRYILMLCNGKIRNSSVRGLFSDSATLKHFVNVQTNKTN